MREVPWILPIRRGQVGFGQSHAGLKVTGDRLFGDLLPGDVNAEGLKPMGLGMSGGQRKKLFVGVSGGRAGVLGPRLLRFSSLVPVVAKLDVRFL